MKAIRYLAVCLCVLLPVLLLAQKPPEKERVQWVQLGTTQIDNDFFSYVFRIRKNAGAFSRLELRINGIFMLDAIIVRYEDKESWSAKEYPTFPIRKEFLVVIPDNGKRIKTVEIRYHDVGGPINKAAVSLWGGRFKKPKAQATLHWGEAPARQAWVRAVP
jgi:hypothetical protein